MENLDGDSVEDRKFEVICRHKDSNPSNLNKVFDSYGCQTLEAKVPVVSDPVVGKLKFINPEQQMYSTLAFKAESAIMAMQGRYAGTSNKPLKMVEVMGETILVAGKTRERDPVDRNELDDEIEQYMKERARLKMKVKIEDQGCMTERVGNVELNDDDMDNELDAYMKEAARLKAQKKQLEEQTDRMTAMMDLEDFEDDTQDENIEL